MKIIPAVLLVLFLAPFTSHAETVFRFGLHISPQCERRSVESELYQTNEKVLGTRWVRFAVIDRCVLDDQRALTSLQPHKRQEISRLQFDESGNGSLRLRGLGFEIRSDYTTFRARVRAGGVFFTIRHEHW